MYECHRQAGLASPALPFFVALFLSLTLFYNTARAQSMRLPVVNLTIQHHTLHAEVAATPKSRSLGLMHRQSLPPDTGMLFVFERTGQPCFWMKNTPLPLSIAFIDDNGAIVNMADMQPNTRDNHCPVAPIRYALEMQQGWFKDKGIQPGDTVHNLPSASIALP